MQPPPVKIVNYVKLLGKHGQRKFQLIYLVQRHIKYPLVCIIYKFNNYSKKNTGEKYKIKQCSLEFISNYMRFLRKIKKKYGQRKL